MLADGLGLPVARGWVFLQPRWADLVSSGHPLELRRRMPIRPAKAITANHRCVSPSALTAGPPQVSLYLSMAQAARGRQ